MTWFFGISALMSIYLSMLSFSTNVSLNEYIFMYFELLLLLLLLLFLILLAVLPTTDALANVCVCVADVLAAVAGSGRPMEKLRMKTSE